MAFLADFSNDKVIFASSGKNVNYELFLNYLVDTGLTLR